MCGVNRKDRKRNIVTHKHLGIALIEDKTRENRLKWYEHMLMGYPDAIVKRGEMINVNNTRRGRGRF